MASPFLKAAQAGIKAFEKLDATEVAIVTRTTSTFDPATRTTVESDTEYEWTVVVEDYREGMADGSSIKAGDRRVVGAAADLAITPDPTTDTLTLGGLEYTIVPSGLRRDPASATWTVQVRR